MKYKKMLDNCNCHCNEHIRPRCFTCTKWPVCNIRTDYLKTAQLMENILGYTHEDYEILPLPFPIPEFKGQAIQQLQKYFPEKIKSTKENMGTFYQAKMENIDKINFIYIINEYYVFFKAVYNEESLEYTIENGIEICYHLQCELSQDALDDIQLGLLSFREDYVQEESEKDNINTTFFSAELNCDFYEWEKGLTYDEGVRRIFEKCSCHNDEETIHHLITIHQEPHKVPQYRVNKSCHSFAPMEYPCYPPHPHHIPTRDELNEI